MTTGEDVTMMQVTRAKVLAYRVAAQGLHRTAGTVDELAVLRLGVQEAMGHPAALALAARLDPSVPMRLGAEYAMAWTMRGAPHVHRRDSLDSLAGALWPMSEADAGLRLNESGPAVQKSGIAALEQFAIAVREMRAVVTSPTRRVR